MKEEHIEQVLNALQDANCPCEMSDGLSPLSEDEERKAMTAAQPAARNLN
jgi:hypothetical protein